MFNTAVLWARQAVVPRLTLMHVAAALLLIASGLANVRYGLSLASNDLERLISVGASLGADLFSAVGLAAAAAAFTRGEWQKGIATSLVLAFTLTYAFVAGIGFASQTRSEVIGHARAVERGDKLASSQLAKVEAELENLPAGRSVGQIQADMTAILATPRVGQCKVIDGPVSRDLCPKYFALDGELEKAKLRSQLVNQQNQLAAKLASATSVGDADPLATSISTYARKLGITVQADTLWPWLSLLFVLVVVLGGPVALWIAERDVPMPVTENKGTARKPATEDAKSSVPAEPAVRARRVTLTPAAGAALKSLRSRGGFIEGKTHTDIANRLGVPRTSFRRVLDRLEGENIVSLTHDNRGYRMQVVQ